MVHQRWFSGQFHTQIQPADPEHLNQVLMRWNGLCVQQRPNNIHILRSFGKFVFCWGLLKSSWTQRTLGRTLFLLGFGRVSIRDGRGTQCSAAVASGHNRSEELSDFSVKPFERSVTKWKSRKSKVQTNRFSIQDFLVRTGFRVLSCQVIATAAKEWWRQKTQWLGRNEAGSRREQVQSSSARHRDQKEGQLQRGKVRQAKRSWLWVEKSFGFDWTEETNSSWSKN